MHMLNAYRCINHLNKVIYANIYGNHFYRDVYLKR